MEAKEAQIFEGERITSSIGLMITIISFGMLFASLFLGFAVLRINSPVWPPMGFKRPDLFYPILSTLIIGISSFFIEKFSRALKKPDFFLSLSFGILFLFSQFSLWKDLKDHGIFASSGIFGSLIYALTWVHAGHMVLGLSLLLFLIPLIFKSEYTNKNKLKINNVTKFWHFLAIVWVLMFFFLFIF